MPSVIVPIQNVEDESLAQLEYALAFASEDLVSARIDREAAVVRAEVASEDACERVSHNIQELLQRHAASPFPLPSEVHFRQDRDRSLVDAWTGLVERRWVTPVGLGHVILRGPAARLLTAIDRRVEREFARTFGAELEIYPPTIRSETLDRCAHFTSFPEHVDFVAHLKQDLQVLDGFSSECRERGWSPRLHDGRMAASDLAISPSCCYHCYEGMAGWDLTPPGRTITATLACHRYEGANHHSLARLRAFTMREVIFVGEPRFVIESRAKAEARILDWARDWELSCSFETANDMFFSHEFSRKASFQRLLQAKKELRLHCAGEGPSIGVFSSNFHDVTFGKAFGITVGGRPASSGCVGWGYERWVLAIFSQFGFDTERWPPMLRDELERTEVVCQVSP